MQGSPKVIAELQKLLAGELAARDQYFSHSRMCLSKLAAHYDHERQEEGQHANAIIQRLLFLGGVPDLNQQDQLNVGHDVVSMLKNDLALEYHVSKALKAAMQLCEQEQDYISREMLRTQLSDTEEDHAYWLEKQLRLIDLIGLQNYLQSQI